jgi:electron transfer flavoprotein alpha subunit
MPGIFDRTQIGTLVIVEHRSGKVDAGTLNTIQAALSLGPEVSCLVSGYGGHLDEVARSAFPVSKVSTVPPHACCELRAVLTSPYRQVLVARHPSLEHQLAEPMALLVTALQARFSFSHILAPGTAFGGNTWRLSG